MPGLHDITVRVTNANGQDLKEWGTQHLRKKNLVSCYVQSETDMSFKVSMQPKIPYITPDAADAHKYYTRSKAYNRQDNSDKEDEWVSYSDDDGPGSNDESHKNTSSWRRNSTGEQQTTRERKDKAMSYASASTRRKLNRTLAPPFHLLARLYLDGRSNPERKMIIYLDPKHKDFRQPDGKEYFESRCVQGKDGHFQEHSWLFKDVGIETVFDKTLFLGEQSASETVYKREEEELLAAMGCTDLEGLGTGEDQKLKVGQILVTFERVILGIERLEYDWRPSCKEEEDDDLNMEGTASYVTHTTGLGKARPAYQGPVRVVGYTDYKQGEGNYASFQFFYRSEEKLRRFNFPGFPKPQITTPPRSTPRTRRHLDNQLANMTPLSFSNPLHSLSKGSKERASTFEDRVKTGRPLKETTTYTFRVEYRNSNKEEDEEIMNQKEQESHSPAQVFSSQSMQRDTSLLQRQGYTDSTSGEEMETNEARSKRLVTEDILRKCLLAAPTNTTDAPASSEAALSTDASSSSDLKPSPKRPGRSTSLTMPTTTLPPLPPAASPTGVSKRSKQFLTIPHSSEIRQSPSETDADDEYESGPESHLSSDMVRPSSIADSLSDGQLGNDELYGDENDDQGLHSQLGDLDIRKRGHDDVEEGASGARIEGSRASPSEKSTDNEGEDDGLDMLAVSENRGGSPMGSANEDDNTARVKRQKNMEGQHGEEGE